MAGVRRSGRFRRRWGKPGKNCRGGGEFRTWIASIDNGALAWFGAQLSLLMTLALELDRGNTTNGNTYRGVLADINSRIDRLYGTQTLDAVIIMSRRIDENEIARVAKGWG